MARADGGPLLVSVLERSAPLGLGHRHVQGWMAAVLKSVFIRRSAPVEEKHGFDKRLQSCHKTSNIVSTSFTQYCLCYSASAKFNDRTRIHVIRDLPMSRPNLSCPAKSRHPAVGRSTELSTEVSPLPTPPTGAGRRCPAPLSPASGRQTVSWAVTSPQSDPRQTQTGLADPDRAGPRRRAGRRRTGVALGGRPEGRTGGEEPSKQIQKPMLEPRGRHRTADT